jgi:hypothetical protein
LAASLPWSRSFRGAGGESTTIPCAEDGFDLMGKPSDSDRCAECGASVTQPGAIRIGHRRRQTRPLLLALLVLLLCGTVGGVRGWRTARTLKWVQYEPTWLLERQADWSRPSPYPLSAPVHPSWGADLGPQTAEVDLILRPAAWKKMFDFGLKAAAAHRWNDDPGDRRNAWFDMGTVFLPRGKQTSAFIPNYDWYFGSYPYPAKTIDIALKPKASASPVGTNQVWGGQLMLKGIPVRPITSR